MFRKRSMSKKILDKKNKKVELLIISYSDPGDIYYNECKFFESHPELNKDDVNITTLEGFYPGVDISLVKSKNFWNLSGIYDYIQVSEILGKNILSYFINYLNLK